MEELLNVHCLTITHPSSSHFDGNSPLSRLLLNQCLSFVGRFGGLLHFDYLDVSCFSFFYNTFSSKFGVLDISELPFMLSFVCFRTFRIFSNLAF